MCKSAVHPHMLTSAFFHCIVSLVSVSGISRLLLVFIADQTGLCVTWSETPKTGFLGSRLKFVQSQLIPIKLKSNFPLYCFSKRVILFFSIEIFYCINYGSFRCWFVESLCIHKYENQKKHFRAS